MNFYNIKHTDEVVSFKEATLQGLGKDKGLFVPVEIPVLSQSFFDNIEGLTDNEIATTVLYPYVEGSLSREALSSLLAEVFTFDTPVKTLLE